MKSFISTFNYHLRLPTQITQFEPRYPNCHASAEFFMGLHNLLEMTQSTKAVVPVIYPHTTLMYVGFSKFVYRGFVENVCEFICEPLNCAV